MSVRFDTIGKLVSCDRTDAGFYRIRARLTRTGVFPYATASGVSRELRHPDQIFDEASLETARAGLPVTIGHLGMITPANIGAKVGQTVTDVSIEDGLYLTAEVQIEDAGALARIDRGELTEVSAGYFAECVPESGVYEGQRYDARHTNVRYNHLALLGPGQGRQGSDVSLRFDAAEDVGYGTAMDLVEIKIGDQSFMVPAEVAAEIARLSGMAEGQAEGEAAAEAILSETPAPASAEEPVMDAALVAVEAPKTDASDVEALVSARVALVERVRSVKPSFTYAGQTSLELMREALSESGIKCDGKDESWLAAALEILPQVKAHSAAPAALKIDAQDKPEPKQTPDQIMAERDARRADMWKR